MTLCILSHTSGLEYRLQRDILRWMNSNWRGDSEAEMPFFWNRDLVFLLCFNLSLRKPENIHGETPVQEKCVNLLLLSTPAVMWSWEDFFHSCAQKKHQVGQGDWNFLVHFPKRHIKKYTCEKGIKPHGELSIRTRNGCQNANLLLMNFDLNLVCLLLIGSKSYMPNTQLRVLKEHQ